MACLRLVTAFPLRPDFSVPFFIAFISRSTDLEALGLYFFAADFFAAVFFAADFFTGAFFAAVFFATLAFLVLDFFVLVFLDGIFRLSSIHCEADESAKVVSAARPSYGFLSDAMSITKRYFTSAFTTRSKASLIFWMGMTSTSETMLCSAQ